MEFAMVQGASSLDFTFAQGSDLEMSCNSDRPGGLFADEAQMDCLLSPHDESAKSTGFNNRNHLPYNPLFTRYLITCLKLGARNFL
jgi:hypothetical protein